MAGDIKFRSDMKVDLVDHMGGDHSIVKAARVSTASDDLNQVDLSERDKGLINYLVRERHSSPLEHLTMTFRVEMPLFVARQAMRHRVSWNEQSARYTEIPMEFYVPSKGRKLTQTGKVGEYQFDFGSEIQQAVVDAAIRKSSTDSAVWYQEMLNMGIAKEVARMVLPVNVYTIAYVSMNSRYLMNFLSLRATGTHAQGEIQTVADQMEEHFARIAPITHEAFNTHGRVAP